MLTPEQFKSFSRVSSFRPVLDISLNWGMIAGALYLTHLSLFFLPFSLVIIATRLHSLIVMMHDGAHYLLHKNEIINDLLSNVCCSFIVQISTEAYRKTHHKHHQSTQTDQDPNYVIMRREEAWRFPKPKSVVKKILWRDLFLMTMKDHMIILKDWQVLPNFKNLTRLEKISYPIFLGTVIALTTYFGLWMDFFIVQGASLLINPIVRIRAMSEHIHQEASGQGKVSKLRETTTINAGVLEKFFIAPLNTNRHLEHHLYPTIPYYNLEKVHAVICTSDLYKANCRYELDGYFLGAKTSFETVLCEETGQKISGKAAA